MPGPHITINAGTGGKVENLLAAGAVAGGFGNEVTGPPVKGGVETDLSDAKINIEGPAQNAEFKNVKLLGLVEGGIESKLKETKSATEKPDREKEERYRMQAEPRGLCYIFNNKDFDGKEKRTGTDKDRDDIAEAFEKLKFKVKYFDNSEADIMEMRVRKLSKEDHSAYDCVVVIFLTHGREGAVQGTDNDWLDVNTITSYFKTHSSPTLAKKPKLFFFQSCRGTKYQKGEKLQTDGGDDDGNVVAVAVKEELVAPEADFFFGYSTVPGTKSVRNVETGSWYIQELAKTLTEMADKDDLLGIMTTVGRRVDEHQYECTDGSFLKQTAETTNRLLKKLYFL